MENFDRKKLIKKYFDKSEKLTVTNTVYKKQLEDLWHWLTHADCVANDITTKSLMFKGNRTAEIASKQEGVIAGIEEISYLIKTFLPQLTFKTHVSDGQHITHHAPLITFKGSATDLLSFERTILNIFGRMSGIATDTHSLVSKLENIEHAPFIAATRKTPWMLLDKKAVSIGGGLTHRLSLSDSILIKDNHLIALQKEYKLKTIEAAIKKAIEQVLNYRHPEFISGSHIDEIPKQVRNDSFFEIEVANILQAQAAIETFNNSPKYEKVMALLFDNMAPGEISALSKNPHVIFETSGNITHNNYSTWIHSGVDIISMGSLTHSNKQFDLSLQIV